MVRAALVAMLAPALLLPATALADGKVSGRDSAGDVKAKGLTAKERRALDIVSVTARGDQSTGLMVTVRFRGNFERAIGRGHLKNGLAALVLRPRAKGKRPTGLLTTGAGRVGITRRRTASDDVGVIRDGRKLTFFIAGRALKGIKSVEVKAFARRVGRARTSTKLDVAVHWLQVSREEAADTERITANDLKSASCGALEAWQAVAKSQRARLEKSERGMTQLRDDIAKALNEIENRNVLAAIDAAIVDFIGIRFVESQADLAGARKLVDRAIARNKETRDDLLRFQGKIDGLLSAKCKQVDTVVGPPVIKSP